VVPLLFVRFTLHFLMLAITSLLWASVHYLFVCSWSSISCMTNLMLLLIMELPTPSSKIFVLLGLAPQTSIKIEGSRYTPSDSIYSAHNSWPAYQGGHWFNFSGLICQLIRAEADEAGYKRKPAPGIGNAQTNTRKLRKSYTQSKKNRREYCRVCLFHLSP